MGRSFPIGVPRKANPRLQPQNGMQLPQRRPSGKCIPESVSRMGRSFRMSPHAESLSRNEPSERDTLSETRPIGKLHPALSRNSGTQFPANAETESASRYRCLEWDALSQWMLMRKPCPGIRLQSGMQFPVEPRLGNGVPLAQRRAARMLVRTARLARYVETSNPLRNTKRRYRHWRERSYCRPSWALCR